MMISKNSSFSLDYTRSTAMTLDSLSESSLLRLEHYLNSNPYREYAMNKPYFPRPPQSFVHTNRLIAQQPQTSILAFHELIDNQKNALTLDRLAYKLRMKSDLNIDTLRETHLRRRHFRQQRFHTQPIQPNHIHSNISDSLSSIPPSISTKTSMRQPTAITMSSNTMKTLVNEDLNGIEGSAVRVGTLNDLLKQFRRAEFRLVRRPADYLDSASTYFSSNVSTNDRTVVHKPHQQQTERTIKQPQALTEYHFNGPTFPRTPSRANRDPTSHQGLVYQYRTRERIHPPDLPLVNQRPMITPDHPRQRLNSFATQERPTVLSTHDKRVHELREKTLMRTEKQLCVCNKLTIVDPFNSSSDQSDSTLPQIQQFHSHYQQQPLPAVNYIFPPVRPFGYLTKKTSDDTQPFSSTQSSGQQPKKKQGIKKKRYKTTKNSLESLDKLEIIEPNDDDENNSQLFNDTIQSMVSLTELDDETHNKTINIDLNLAGIMIQNTDEHEKS